MVTALAVVWAAVAAAPPALKSATTPPAPVRQALGEGKYPWYDAPTDSVRPLWPASDSRKDTSPAPSPRTIPGWLAPAGDLLATGLSMLALAILLAILVELWRRHRPGVDSREPSPSGPARASRIEELPEGLRPESNDPWSEALRCRAQGDYARAVVCLFAHQLLTLDRLRHVRLAPGRTGRQLVRAIADRPLRASVEPTLSLFEAVYYGHHVPSAAAFEPVWAAAEDFQKQVAEGGAR